MSSSSQTQAPGRPRLWTANFLLVCLAAFFLFTGFQMLMPTLPLYIQYLGGAPGLVGLVTGIFVIAAVVARPWLGLQIDRRGRKGIYLAGLLVFIAMAAAYHWAGGIAALLVLRVIHGLGWGATTTAGGTLAADLIPAARRGEGMGYYGLFSNLAMALAPALGLWLVGTPGAYHFSWVFFTSAALALVALLCLLPVREGRPEAQAGAARPALFEPQAFAPALVMFFTNIGYGGVMTFLSLYAAQFNITNIGVFFAVFAGVLMVIRPLAGTLADRRGAALVVVPGLLLLAAAMVVLALAQNLAWFLAAALLSGLGFGSVQPTMQALTVQGIPANRRGAANATFYSAFDLGIGAGSIFLGLISQHLGYRGAYLGAALAVLFSLLIFLLQGRARRPAVAEN